MGHRNGYWSTKTFWIWRQLELLWDDLSSKSHMQGEVLFSSTALAWQTQIRGEESSGVHPDHHSDHSAGA
jgi:hypothetical protein